MLVDLLSQVLYPLGYFYSFCIAGSSLQTAGVVYGACTTLTPSSPSWSAPPEVGRTKGGSIIEGDPEPSVAHGLSLIICMLLFGTEV